MQLEAWTCRCPSCGWVQRFRPEKRRVSGSRSTQCKRCGVPFNPEKQEVEEDATDVDNAGRPAAEFVRYSKSGGESGG